MKNWFLYWKISPSLWRTRLAELKTPGPIIVPLNWAFHSETGEDYDFAGGGPLGANLGRLVALGEEWGRKVLFFLPLGPAPYLPNGGLPPLLARTCALDRGGVAYGVLDGEGDLNKLYTFFDTRVYRAFTKYVSPSWRVFCRSRDRGRCLWYALWIFSREFFL